MNKSTTIWLLVLLMLIAIFFAHVLIKSRNTTANDLLPIDEVTQDNPFLINSTEDLPLTVQFASSRCLGDCPIYRILIMYDGTAYFDGEANTVDNSVHKMELSANIMNQLKEKILEVKFFDMNIQSSVIFDVSYNYLGVGWNEKSKSMSYISGQDLPRELYDLQCFIHTIIESSKWVGMTDWSCARLDQENIK